MTVVIFSSEAITEQKEAELRKATLLVKALYNFWVKTEFTRMTVTKAKTFSETNDLVDVGKHSAVDRAFVMDFSKPLSTVIKEFVEFMDNAPADSVIKKTLEQLSKG